MTIRTLAGSHRGSIRIKKWNSVIIIFSIVYLYFYYHAIDFELDLITLNLQETRSMSQIVSFQPIIIGEIRKLLSIYLKYLHSEELTLENI